MPERNTAPDNRRKPGGRPRPGRQVMDGLARADGPADMSRLAPGLEPRHLIVCLDAL